MNESYIRKLYSLLGHSDYWSRVGSLDCTSHKYEDKLLHGVEEVIDYARRWNGQRNLFISRNPRNQDGSINSSHCITFDCDPVRPKGEAATDAQHDNAITAGRRILENYGNGYLCSSGNGCLLIFPGHTGRDELELFYQKEKIFIERLNQLVEDLNVKIDPTSYKNAVIKLLGTVSTKGDKAYHRLSRILHYVAARPGGVSISDEIRSLPTSPVQPISEKFEGDPVQRITEAKEVLGRLNGEYCNDYTKWLTVGMALKEFGVSGLTLWRNWSKESDKYEEGICEKKWASFDETPQVTLGTLKYWAENNRVVGTGERRVSLSRDDYFDGLFCTDSGSESAITTGIESVDHCLRALPRGEITTIAARSGFGKSSFGCTVAESLRKRGKLVLYFSTEMSTEYILHKFVAIRCGIPMQKLIEKDLTEEEGTRIRQYQQELLHSPVIICDEFSPKIEQVRELVEQHKPDILIFDHATQSGTHWEYVAQFVRALKELTTQKGLVTILASQLNEPPRGSNGSVGNSVRGDIRGSQEIIFLSAIFMMMNNIYETKTDVQPVELEICKNRYGVSGIKLEIHVDKSTGFFHT